MPIDCSWIKKLGVAKSTCRQAASASGPRGQCGAMATSKVSASAAIRRTSEMPPAWARSGCKTATPASSAGSTSQREYIRSPVAIGTGLEEISRARFAWLFSVSTGSSTKSGWYGSSCGRRRRAAGGGGRPRGRGGGGGGGEGRGSGGCREPTVEVDCEVELGAERLAHEGGTFDYFGVVRLAGQMCALRRPIHFDRRQPRLTLSTPRTPHPPPARAGGAPGDAGWTVPADPTVDTHLVAHVAAK